MANGVLKRILHFEWSSCEPLHAFACLPAVVVPLYLGVHTGNPGTGVLLAGGGMCVGFGSFQRPLIWRWGPMLAAAIGIGISGALGVLCSGSAWLLTLVVTLFAFLYGLANANGPVTAWVGQQCCVYLVISASSVRYFTVPANGLLWASVQRGGGLLLGGLIQFILILFIWKFIPRAPSTFTDPNFSRESPRLAAWQQALHGHGADFWFALQTAATGLAAMLVFERVSFNNSYWIPMTALLIPRQVFTDTTARTIMRFTGTILGAVVATVVAVFMQPRGEALTLLVGLFLFATYCLQNVNYGAFAVFLTGYIVFLLAIVRAPRTETLQHRIEATLIGGLIAFVVHLLFLFRQRYVSA